MFSVGSENEAEMLLTFACPRNLEGDYVAPELGHEQTLENLAAFSDRLTQIHDEHVVSGGWCECGKEQPKEQPKEEVIMATATPPEGWNPEWGDPADYNITDETELDGYHVGESVRVIEDDEAEGVWSGDEGPIVGISRTGPGTFNPSGKVELIVAFSDRSEPLGVVTDNVELA